MKRVAITAVVVLAAAAATGCEKPNPGVTVWAGTSSNNSRAICWSANPGESVTARGCAQDVVSKALNGGTIPQVTVVPGDTIGISVDPVVADLGWIPEVGNQPLVQAPIKETYFRFTYPDLQPVPAEGLELRVVASGENTSAIRGLWVYQLMPAGA